MPVKFTCTCGEVLHVPDEHAGRRVRCSECKAVSTVPLSLDDPPKPAAPVRFVNGRPAPAEEPQPADAGDPFDFTTPDESAKKGKSLEGQMVNGGVLGGIVMMLIAVVWFVVGIVALDMIYFYPPILFVVGIVAIVRGLMEKAR